MIRVNLNLDAKALRMATDTGEDIVDQAILQREGIKRLVIILLIPVGLIVYERQNIPELQSKISSKNAYIVELSSKNAKARGAVSEITKFKEDQAKLQAQIDSIEILRKQRMREVQILDTIQKETPSKLWLSKIDLKEDKLQLNGYATSDLDVSMFMEALSRSVFLQQVNLIKSEERTESGTTLKYFTIDCALDGAK